MSELKEYIVTLHRHEDLDAFYQDMETEGGDLYIPNRAVECHVRRPVSRNTHYMLSDQEAAQLRLDPRVLAVELTPEQLGIEMVPAWTQTSSLWSKADTLSQGELNWGLLRCTDGQPRENWYSNSISTLGIASGTVTVPFSGKNVDVVIVDGRMETAHPEFAVNLDGSGGSRVVQYNWYSLNPTVTGGAAGTYSYTPQDTTNDWHGSFCAGIAAGNTHGWARDANIYNIATSYTTGGVSRDYLFDYIRVWHQNKPINPATGRKNPTILNCSFGFFYTMPISDVVSVTYRGTVYSGPFTGAQLASYGLHVSGTNVIWSNRVTAVDTDVADCIAAGIIVVGSAMNNYMKMDVVGGVDYNNTVNYIYQSGTFTSTTPHQGTTPASTDNVICVGGVSALYNAAGEQKRVSSNCGPRIDVFAPGENIRSSSNVYSPGGTVTDARNSSFYVGKSNGTSFAAPQVTGLLATMLELNPAMTPSAAMSYITSNAKTGQMYSSNNLDYRDLQGAPNRYLFAAYPTTMSITPNTATVTPSQTVSYTITMTGAPNGSLVYLTDSGTSISSDFVDGFRQYAFSVIGGTVSFSRTVSAGVTGSRTSILQLRTGGYDGNIQATATTVTISASNNNVVEVPYGNNFLQRVDLLVPAGVVKGVVVWIHGGAWNSGAKSNTGFTSGQAAWLDNDYSNMQIVADAGYVVVNCAYRLTSQASLGYGGDGTGGYPNAVNDIKTILNYCMVSSAGAAASSSWQTIYNYVNTYGLFVAGTSAGGHLAVQAVGEYGTSSGKWPKAVLNMCGPMDLVYNNTDIIISPNLQRLVNLFSYPGDSTGSTKNTTNLIAASPRFQYGTSANPGPWYTALNASSCKFYFVQNTNDTLVTSAMITPFINSLPSSKVNSLIVTEGTAGGEYHNFTTPVSTFVINIANSELPISMLTSFPPFPPSSYVSFSAVSDVTSLNWYIAEGQYTATFTLTTSGIPFGTVLYWTTLRSTATITADDFTDRLIQGTITIGSGGTATITRAARADLTTEGSELFRLEIRETGYDSPVVITSTSSVAGNFVGIGDTSTTPTYNEIVTMTSPIQIGLAVPFTISGGMPNTNFSYNTPYSSGSGVLSDSGSISGNIPSNAQLTAGIYTYEWYFVGTGNTKTVSVTATAPVITYVSLTGVATTGGTQLGEGPSAFNPYVTFTLTTTGAVTGTTVYWNTIGESGYGTITTGDFLDGQLQGTATIGSDGTATIVRDTRADLLTEVVELFRLEIRETSSTSLPAKITSGFISIVDTSKTPITYVSLVGVTENPTTSSVADETQYTTITFTLTTTDAPTPTTVYWTTLGSTITSSDFEDGLLQGTATISGNKATITRIVRADLTTEGSDIFRLEVHEIDYSSLVKVTSGPITINDTSLTPPAPPTITTYSSFVGVTDIAEGGASIYEGQYTATFTLTTTNGAGKTVYWTTLGSVTYGTMTTADFSDGQLQGTVIIGSNGIATITRTARADLFTEGVELFYLEIREDSYSNPVKITSNPIGISDTSLTPVAPARSYTSFVGVTDNSQLNWYLSELGATVTFTLTTTGGTPGQIVYWTTLSYVGSITAADFTDNTLEGSVAIAANGITTITRTARADSFTEGSEAFKLEIRESPGTPVKIISTSSDATNAIWIGDVSFSPPASPIYAVAAPEGVTSVNEGIGLIFTVTTTNVATATRLYWSLSNTTDFATSNGTVDITATGINGTGTFTVIPTADTNTEATEETFTASISLTSGGTPVATSASVKINDTSQTPVLSTYAVAAPAGITSINEGSPITFTVTTTNVANGITLNWALSNTTDFATSNGTVVISTPAPGVNGTGTFTVTPTADLTTELNEETFTASIYTGAITGTTPVATSSSIIINDNSKTPGVAIVYTTFTHGFPDGISIFEPPTGGGTTAVFTLFTANAPEGKKVYWTTNLSQFSVSGRPPSAADFTDNTLQGEATLSGNTATITRTVRADYIIEEGSYESFRLEIHEDSYSSPVKIISPYVTIYDRGVDLINNVTIIPATTSVDEGKSVTFAVTTVGANDNSILYWSVSRPEDFAISSGSFTITSNVATISVLPALDQFTDGTETFTVSVLSDPVNNQLFIPRVFATSIPVTINDLSLTRSYTVTPAAVVVNEGTAIEFTINTVNVPSNTQLFWSVSNSGDFSTSAGTVTIQGNLAKFSVTPILDYITETPAETFTASISLTSGGTPVVTSDPVTIRDVLAQPIYVITPATTSIAEGSALRFDVTTTNVPAQTDLYWTVNNPVPVYVPPTPVYIITPAANSVDEGSSLRINVSGSNIPDDTYWWTIGDNSRYQDFGVINGSFTITSNSGFFNVSPTADVTTENTPETFVVTVRTGSITGIPVVTTLTPITINDTSQAPFVPTYAIAASADSVGEGSSITFTVTTTNFAAGPLNWGVSVSSQGEFAPNDRGGIVQITTTGTSGTGTFSVTPRADATTEAATEKFTVSIFNGPTSGIPVATSNEITIIDDSKDPVAATYAVAEGADRVSEGFSITFYVTTTNVVNGTSLNWALSNTTDFAIYNGTVNITTTGINGTGSFTVTPRADLTTEPTTETFTASVYIGTDLKATSGFVTIDDTSQTPPPPTYAVTTDPVNVSSVDEGTAVTFKVTITNPVLPTTLYWAVLDNTGDFTTYNGQITITTGNSGTFTVTPTADLTTELVSESFRVGIRTSAISQDNVATSGYVIINDTSQTPLIPTYAVAPANGATSVDEGVALQFNVTTTNVTTGTTLYWAYKDGSAIAADLTVSSGFFTINSSGQGTFSVTPIADDATEGPQTFRISILTGSVTGNEEDVSVSVIINDTSLTPVPPPSAIYAVTSASSVDEGSPITFTVTTTNVLVNTPLYWSVNNASEFVTSSGVVYIGANGQGTFSVTPLADATSEGTEQFRATIKSISSSGNIEAISDLVTINDTSLPPPSPNLPIYLITPAAGAVAEGVELSFTVNTTYVDDNTSLTWKVSTASAGDFGISTGFVTIISGTGTIKVTPALDVTTEGEESFTVSIFTSNNLIEPVATSTSVSIVDSSQGPLPLPEAEYYITPAALSVNEGVPLIFTVTTVNIDPNTRVWWEVFTNAGDFTISSGSVLLLGTPANGSFSVTPTQDSVVEPAESFTVTIRKDSASGDRVVTSTLITINAAASLSQLFTTKITPTVYNNARAQIAGVLGVTTTGQIGATQGYGQVLASSAVSQHEKITEVQLDNLRLDIVKTRIHQSDSDPNLINVAAGGLALADSFDAYTALAATSNTLKDQIGPNQLANTTYTQTATYSAYTGTVNTGGGWKNYAFYEVAVTFATADDARYFFNAGSSFKFAASRTGGTVAPTVGLNQNTAWTTLLAGVTNVDKPTFAKSNFYTLSNTYSTVFNKNSLGQYSANYYRISAKSNVASNNYGGATVVTFKIEFVDAFNDGNTTNYDGVDGIFESSIVRSMPKGLGFGGAISVAAPTSVTPTPSNAFTVDGAPIYITAAYQISASPTSVTEAGATINFTFTASNYNVSNGGIPNTVTWFITSTSITGLADFVGDGWTTATNVGGFKQWIRTTNLAAASTFAASLSTTSIVTNPDALTEGPETFTVVAVPLADGSGGGIASDPITITVTDSSKTATPGYALSVPTASPQLSCIPGEGLGASATWYITSVSLTGAAPLVIYGIYLDMSANNNINAYKMTLWDGTVLTETTTTFYTLPVPKSVANGSNVSFTIQVGSINGTAGTGSVTLRFRTNAGSVDGSGPNIVGPSYAAASQSVSVLVTQPTIVLLITANPSSVNYNYISGSTGSASTEITVTNNGNVRATLSNYNVSTPGGTVSPGLISGLILAGGTKTTTVTYSTTSAYNGTSTISITGENILTGTVNANRNVAVNATQAFGIISQRFSLASDFSGAVNDTKSFTIVIDNSGLAPLTVTNIAFGGTSPFSFMTVSPSSISFTVVIPAGGSQAYFFSWNRARIGSGTVTASITSNTGGVAGTITSVSQTFTGTATTPTFTLTGSGTGNVVGTSWTSNNGILPKEGSVRLAFAGLEPNAPGMVALFWTQDQNYVGNGGRGAWATSEQRPGGLVTDPKLVPTATLGTDGTYVPWPGNADPYETRYWRAGKNRFYVQLPVGRTDAGTQVWYTNARSGTSAAAAGQWATNTTTPEAACGANQTWIGFTVQPRVEMTLSTYEVIHGTPVSIGIRGAASDVEVILAPVSYTVDTGTFTTGYPTFPSFTTTNAGTQIGEFSTSDKFIGTYNLFRIISPSGAGDNVFFAGPYVTFDILSPAFSITTGYAPANWGVGDIAAPAPIVLNGDGSLPAGPTGKFYYWRRVGANNATYTNINVYAACDDVLEVYCQGVLLATGGFNISNLTQNRTVTVTDGYSHWRFVYTNGGGPGFFAVGVYVGAVLYFALNTPDYIRSASKW